MQVLACVVNHTRTHAPAGGAAHREDRVFAQHAHIIALACYGRRVLKKAKLVLVVHCLFSGLARAPGPKALSWGLCSQSPAPMRRAVYQLLPCSPCSAAQYC
jgi:hypothetical protein